MPRNRGQSPIIHMSKIDELRNSLTEPQRNLLDSVWLHRLQKKEWPPIRAIEYLIDTENIITRDVAQSLGGSVVYETQANNQDRYALTLLGVILAPTYGVEAETLLTQYLDYVRARYSENQEMEKITSTELMRDK